MAIIPNDIAARINTFKKNLEGLATPENAADLRAFILASVEGLDQTLEERMRALHEAHRQELHELNQQQEAAFRRQALWQWLIVAGAVVVAWLK